jgi:hypothetical protein
MGTFFTPERSFTMPKTITVNDAAISAYDLRKEVTPEFMGELLGDMANINRLKARETAKALKYQHRYLQQEVIKFLVSVLFWYAAESGNHYDARNEWAVKFCQELVRKADAAEINAYVPIEAADMVRAAQ